MKNSKTLLLASLSILILTACQPQSPAPNNQNPSPVKPPISNSEIPTDKPPVSSPSKPTSPTTPTTPAPETPVPDSVTISLNTPFTLKPGQTAVYSANSSSITFVKLESDSRCAIGVQCVWAGEATLSLKIKGFLPTSDNIEAYYITTLHNTLDLGNLQGKGYTLELTDVTPYPENKVTISPENRQATFVLKLAK